MSRKWVWKWAENGPRMATVNNPNACPAEVIRQFINRSWRFMSAYRLGLTKKNHEMSERGTHNWFFCSKNLAKRKPRGKNSGEGFLDVSELPESESEVSFLQKNLVQPVCNLMPLTVLNCNSGWTYIWSARLKYLCCAWLKALFT